jgi:GT2 family glycosyltransferase
MDQRAPAPLGASTSGPTLIHTVPPSDTPAVSVIVVTYGRWDVVDSTLLALVQNTKVPYELIVVDNASPDETRDRVLDSIVGARVVRNDRNVGFGCAANQGALHATSKYLCFLNSDAIVTPGWLEPLLAALDNDPTCGSAISCLLNDDGTLQEAGPFIDGDGQGRPYGYGQDPTDAQYRFVRRVDYGSGACLVVRRAAFALVGGFDPCYGIGYYEDVDLALHLLERGWHTVYQPASRVRHLRGASSSEDEAHRLIEANRRVFNARWGPYMEGRVADRHLAQDPDLLVALRDRRAVPRTLVIEDPKNRVRLRAYAATLATSWPQGRVTLLARMPDPTGDDVLRETGVEVLPTPSEALQSFLHRRRYHYSVVIIDLDAAVSLHALLEATQPQAQRILVTNGPRTPTALAVASLRRARLLLCETSDQVAWAKRSCGTPAVALSATAQPAAFAFTLSEVGFEPPAQR